MTASRIVLVDGDAHTAAVLAAELERRGFGAVTVVPAAASLPLALAQGAPDVLVVNHRYGDESALAACRLARQHAPECATVVVTAPGPALAAVHEWARQLPGIDVIAEKPFVDDRFYWTLTELLAAKAAVRESRRRAERLAQLLPEGAVSSAGEDAQKRAELFEAAVLFTDIRDSSRLANQMAPREFFDVLNLSLSEQTSRIRLWQGSVVKYTGDGVMAVFRGMGRSYLALRCGLELAAMSSGQRLPYGVGIAQGLVLGGLIGDAGRTGQLRQFDVIGATAHLAARLCALADPGQLVATNGVNAVAQVRTPQPRPIAQVSIRGFAAPVDCVKFSFEAA
ncbi:adenylate/guanylate cyclase domain-containing protein [Caenimonas terrae]|uniref:Adenylate/guanylate cyclase domain-containing protein n=1 Tax=Caenimonas terrae TaxID=696074 RepID=A0ABW0N798_9BURK